MKYILLAVFVLCSIPVSAHDVLIKRSLSDDIKHYNVTFEINDCVTNKIEKIPGVERSCHNRYEITVTKGSNFSWTTFGRVKWTALLSKPPGRN